MDTSRSILHFARRFLAGTLLSRVSGFAREMTMAFCFGSAPEIAAFMVAFRFANLFRRVLGEGNLSSSFIPHFESLQGKDRRQALLFFRDTALSLFVVAVAIVAVFMGALWLIGHFMGGGWGEISLLAMWMAPGLIFI